MAANILIGLFVMLIAGLAARDDWRGLSIPDQHSLVLLILFPLAALSPADITFIPGVIAGLLTLFLGLCLFALKVMGGGDVKLASVLALYTGLAHWPYFMLLTMLNGGILALITLYLRRYPEKIPAETLQQSWLGQVKADPENAVLPYGLAIAVAAFVILIQRLIVPPVLVWGDF